MKRTAAVVLGLLATAGIAQAGGFPAPLSLVQREPKVVHQHPYVGPVHKKLPQPLSLVEREPRAVNVTPFVRGYR